MKGLSIPTVVNVCMSLDINHLNILCYVSLPSLLLPCFFVKKGPSDLSYFGRVPSVLVKRFSDPVGAKRLADRRKKIEGGLEAQELHDSTEFFLKR